MSHAGSVLLAQIADKSGLTGALSVRLADLKARRSGHDPGRVVRDVARDVRGLARILQQGERPDRSRGAETSG